MNNTTASTTISSTDRKELEEVKALYFSAADSASRLNTSSAVFRLRKKLSSEFSTLLVEYLQKEATTEVDALFNTDVRSKMSRKEIFSAGSLLALLAVKHGSISNLSVDAGKVEKQLASSSFQKFEVFLQSRGFFSKPNDWQRVSLWARLHRAVLVKHI